MSQTTSRVNRRSGRLSSSNDPASLLGLVDAAVPLEVRLHQGGELRGLRAGTLRRQDQLLAVPELDAVPGLRFLASRT